MHKDEILKKAFILRKAFKEGKKKACYSNLARAYCNYKYFKTRLKEFKQKMKLKGYVDFYGLEKQYNENLKYYKKL